MKLLKIAFDVLLFVKFSGNPTQIFVQKFMGFKLQYKPFFVFSISCMLSLVYARDYIYASFRTQK